MTTPVDVTPSSDREAHEKMGFHQGWGLCTEQLEAVASKT